MDSLTWCNLNFRLWCIFNFRRQLLASLGYLDVLRTFLRIHGQRGRCPTRKGIARGNGDVPTPVA